MNDLYQRENNLIATLNDAVGKKMCKIAFFKTKSYQVTYWSKVNLIFYRGKSMSLMDTIVHECTSSSLVFNEAPIRKIKRDVDKKAKKWYESVVNVLNGRDFIPYLC